jgi:hypothetical protein
VKGISWGWDGQRGSFDSPAAADSMQKLAATGAEWVCIAFAANMQSYDEPDFAWGAENPDMVTDDEIRHAIALARQNGLKVILKPVVNCADGTWRAWIRFYRPTTPAEQAAEVTGTDDPWGLEPHFLPGMVPDETRWAHWWNRYSEFLLHYAALADEQQVELFCLGCEMSSTEASEQRWRTLIAQVREVYRGLLIYDCNHGRESEVNWWDALDVIGVSAYYNVPPPSGVSEEQAVQQTTSTEEIKRQLGTVKSHLARLNEKWHKPILFIEVGITNVRGCARYPWSHPNERPAHPLDQREQANYYQACFEVFWDEPWFAGYAWWDWPARLYPQDSASLDRGFCVYGKQAEAVVKRWYAKPR